MQVETSSVAASEANQPTESASAMADTAASSSSAPDSAVSSSRVNLQGPNLTPSAHELGDDASAFMSDALPASNTQQSKKKIRRKELMEHIRANLQQLQNLEDSLSATSVHWRQSSSGSAATNASMAINTTSADLNASVMARGGNAGSLLELHTLLERYQKARALYLQRRRKRLFVDQVTTTFDGKTIQPPEMEADKENQTISFNTTHANLVRKVMGKAKSVKGQCEDLYDLYQAVSSRREELEWMLDDVQQDSQADNGDMEEDIHDNDYTKEDPEDEDMTMMTIGVDVNTATLKPVSEETNDEDNLEAQQHRLELLQQKKRKLQQELERIQQETQKVEQRSSDHRQELGHLQQQIQVHRKQQYKERNEGEGNGDDDDDDESDNEVIADGQIPIGDLPSKIQELQEMHTWYDSMRHVMEELSGIKIEKVTAHEELANNLILHLLLLDEHKIEVLLKPIKTKRSTEPVVKLMSAKWASSREMVFIEEDDDQDGVSSKQSSNGGDGDGGKSPRSSFSLTIPPLDDIVQAAQSFCNPLQDVRFLIVEALNRIHTYQERVQELGYLRRDVLCKLVSPEDPNAVWVEVVCSLDIGLVIVLRLYDSNFLVLHRLLGVSGWKDSVVEKMMVKIVASIKEKQSEPPAGGSLLRASVKPREVVEMVQEHVQGLSKPQTPRLPMKRPTNFDFK